MFIQRSQRHLFSLRSNGEIYWIQQHLVYLYLMHSSIKSGAAHPGIKVVCLYCHESVAEGRQHRRRSLCQALKLQVLRCQERPLGVLHFLLFPFPPPEGWSHQDPSRAVLLSWRFFLVLWHGLDAVSGLQSFSHISVTWACLQTRGTRWLKGAGPVC